MRKPPTRFRKRGAARAVLELAANHIWQRLAFPYRYADYLAHRDILERAAPATEAAGFGRNTGSRNVWLADVRLPARVARHRAGEGVADAC